MKRRGFDLFIIGLTIGAVCFMLGYFTGQGSARGTFEIRASLAGDESPLPAILELAASGHPSSMPEKINLNAADRTLLETLPGIGPVLADRIIEYREQNGGFSSIEQITQVSGIGDATYEKLRDLITVSDSNS